MRIGGATTMVFAVLFAAVTGALPACGGDSGDACVQAEQQVTECIDRMCATDEGAFCGCYAAGQHLALSDCACEDDSVWETMQESLCQELDGEPDLDCKGLRATIHRFERIGACE